MSITSSETPVSSIRDSLKFILVASLLGHVINRTSARSCRFGGICVTNVPTSDFQMLQHNNKLFQCRQVNTGNIPNGIVVVCIFFLSHASKNNSCCDFLHISGLDERVLHDCLKFFENHLEKPAGKVGFEKFFTEKGGKKWVLLFAVPNITYLHVLNYYFLHFLKTACFCDL